jgi:hypothetical protein
MLTNPLMRGSIHYGGNPEYLPGHEGDQNYRIYGEPWTADDFIEYDRAIKIKFGNDCEYVMISTHMDLTVVVGLGRGTQLGYTVLSMTLGNFTTAARYANMGISDNRKPIAYMPVFVPGKSAAANHRDERILNQSVLEGIFKCFQENDGFGPTFEIVDANNQRKKVCPGCCVHNCDLEELWKRFLILKGRCPSCTCPPNKLGEVRTVYAPRKTCSQMFAIWKSTPKKSLKRVFNQHGFKALPFWGWNMKQWNVYGMVPYDILHQADKTICGDDLFCRCLTGCLEGTVLKLDPLFIRMHLDSINNLIRGLVFFQFSDLTHFTKCFRNGIRLGDSARDWELGKTISMEGTSTF